MFRIKYIGLTILLIMLAVLGFGCQAPSPVATTPEAASPEANAQLYTSFPSVTVEPGIAEISAGQIIIISGAGFAPEEEIVIETLTYGAINNLNRLSFLGDPPSLEGEPFTDENGSFTVAWTLRRFSRRLDPGVYPIWIRIGDVEVTVPIVYED